MEPTLIAVTLVSLALAVVMLATTARLLRAERRRSEARIAALASGIVEIDASAVNPQPSTPSPSPQPSTPNPQDWRPWPPAAVTTRRRETRSQAKPAVQPKTAEAARFWAGADESELELHHDAPAEASDLFATAARPRSSGRFALSAAVGAIVVGAALTSVYLMNRQPERVDPAAGSGAAARADAPQATLELVSLSHRRDGSKLVIRGIVRNPAGGRAARKVTAVVFLFARDGAFLSSGRAPIDFTTLAAGEESPFVVEMTEPGPVARYRVSFRTDDRVIPHLDRRPEGALARASSFKGDRP